MQGGPNFGFLRLENNSLLFNLDDCQLVFFVPENFFDDTTKNPVAEINGEYVSMIGLCNYAIFDKNGKKKKFDLFDYPTMMLCKPNEIEKVKDYVVDDGIEASDYRLLKFNKGDEVVSQIRTPQIVNNTELLFKILLLSAKIPKGIKYSEGWKEFAKSMILNGKNFKISAQLFGMLWLTVCRDPNNLARSYRFTDCNDEYGYKAMSIKMTPKYDSPYTAITSENFDEGLMSAILMSDKEDRDIPYTPLEKVLMN